MIAIIPIATGQPLDLAPDAEFEIQMEQPLLSDELPAPFSTQNTKNTSRITKRKRTN